MGEQAPPLDSEPSGDPGPPELGDARFARFDGVLDGRCYPPGLLRALVERINASGYCRLSPDITGNRFSLLADDTPLAAGQMTDEKREGFLEGLQALADQLPPGTSVESTLRSTEVFEHGVRETLYSVQAGQVRGVTRLRRVLDEDRDLGPGPRGRLFPAGVGRRRLAWIGALLVVAFVLSAWRAGYLDRLLAPAAATLTVVEGSFDRLVDVELTKSWGMYVVTVTRGPEYPATGEAVAALLAGATTAADRAAINAVADGDEIWVRLESAGGKVLESVAVELGGLLADPAARARGKLAGRIGGATLTLALDSGRKG